MKNWIDYWDQDNFWRDSAIWKINTRLFFRRASGILKFGPGDSVLDVGCGSGQLELLLSPLVQRVLATDSSEQFIQLCKANCRNCANVEVSLLATDYTDLSVWNRKFSIFLCVSVVQYYRNIGELESLIRSAQSVALPGARMLIADLPLKRNLVGFGWDAIGSVLMALREGHFLPLIQAAYFRWVSRSHYQQFANSQKQLFFSWKDLESLIQRMNLQAVIIPKSLSIYANRPSLLIQF